MAGKIVLSFIAIAVVSAGISAYYYYIRRYNFIGKLWSAIIIGIVGAVIFNYLLKEVTKFFIETFNINILAVIIGIVISLELFHKATP